MKFFGLCVVIRRACVRIRWWFDQNAWWALFIYCVLQPLPTFSVCVGIFQPVNVDVSWYDVVLAGPTCFWWPSDMYIDAFSCVQYFEHAQFLEALEMRYNRVFVSFFNVSTKPISKRSSFLINSWCISELWPMAHARMNVNFCAHNLKGQTGKKNWRWWDKSPLHQNPCAVYAVAFSPSQHLYQ